MLQHKFNRPAQDDLATTRHRGLLSPIEKAKLNVVRIDGAGRTIIDSAVPTGARSELVLGVGGNLTANASFDSATNQWNRYDTAQAAALVQPGVGGVVLLTAPAGANPIVWTQVAILREGANDGVTPHIFLNGDVMIQRRGAATTGVLYFGAPGAQDSLSYNGFNFVFSGGDILSKDGDKVAVESSIWQVTAGAALTLTTTITDIPGASLILPTASTYLVLAVYDISVIGADNGQILNGIVTANGVQQSPVAVVQAPTTTFRATVPMLHSITTTGANQTVLLRASKNAGTGTSVVNAQGTRILAIRMQR